VRDRVRNGFACPRMPPCAQEEFTGVKKEQKKPLITLEQLHEHTKPDDLWIGVCSLSPERTVAPTPLQLFNYTAAASRILPHHVPLCVHPVDLVFIHHLRRCAELWMSMFTLAAIEGKVYDLSKWAISHPGGEHLLLNMAGQDASGVYRAFHTPHGSGFKADKLLKYLPHVADLICPPEVHTQKPQQLSLSLSLARSFVLSRSRPLFSYLLFHSLFLFSHAHSHYCLSLSPSRLSFSCPFSLSLSRAHAIVSLSLYLSFFLPLSLSLCARAIFSLSLSLSRCLSLSFALSLPLSLTNTHKLHTHPPTHAVGTAKGFPQIAPTGRPRRPVQHICAVLCRALLVAGSAVWDSGVFDSKRHGCNLDGS